MKIVENHVNVVIVNGAPNSGKTTFEQMCSFILGPYYRARSSVDLVKEVAAKAGWQGVKEPRDRKFLSDLKDLMSAYNNAPFRDIMKYVREFEDELLSYQIDPRKGFIFVDVREPAEIDKLKKATNGTTLLIRRDSAEASKTSNHADANVLNYEYDYVIDNNQTFEDLEVEAKRLIKNLTSFQNSGIVNT